MRLLYALDGCDQAGVALECSDAVLVAEVHVELDELDLLVEAGGEEEAVGLVEEDLVDAVVVCLEGEEDRVRVDVPDRDRARGSDEYCLDVLDFDDGVDAVGEELGLEVLGDGLELDVPEVDGLAGVGCGPLVDHGQVRDEGLLHFG